MPVTATDVNRIYLENTSTGTNLQSFLDLAVDMVAEAGLVAKGLSPTRIDAITLYVMAHFLLISQESGGIQEEKVGDAQQTYVPQDKGATGLSTTRFGRQALMLDTSGSLASLTAGSNLLPAQFRVV